MGVMGKHGISQTTPENILFGAGTYHKNLTFSSTSNKWEGTCIGATSGGGKVSIEGEYIDLDVDGALVLFKGQTVKAGGKATMEVALAEITGDNIKLFANFTEGSSQGASGYTQYVDKANIEAGDYLENFGYVGKTATGKDIIVIFEYALCKSAFELEGKNKSQGGLKAVLEAYSEINDTASLDTLPVKIYYPTAATV